jgi:mevalonate kinase
MKTGDPAARTAIDALGALSRSAIDALSSSGDPDFPLCMAALANEAMGRLRGLGLANQAQDRLIEAGMRAGALGAKLSGAGSGGAFFLIAADKDMAHVIARGVAEQARRSGIALGAPVRALYAGLPEARN